MMRKSTHTKDYAAFLKVLIEARQRAGLTQAQLGSQLPFGQPGISKIERGERRVDVVELRMICTKLGISIEDFIRDFEALLAEQRP
jgi:transcriptional regulator with XRE-family HTH domain